MGSVVPVVRALPVSIACAPRLAVEVERHLDAVLGWQVVDHDSRLVRASAVLADGTVEVGRPSSPVILLVGGEATAAESARRALAVGAAAVLVWPGERERLAEVVAALDAERAPSHGSALVVAGGSGGVGTTTVALALAGLLAWAGREVLAVVTGDVPVGEVPEVGDASLEGPGVWAAAAGVPGVPGLRVVQRGVSPITTIPGLDLPESVAVVLDVGVAPALADVLVVRRDRAGRDAIATSPAGGIALVDDGLLTEAEVLQGAGGRVVAVLPRWARVARAGVRRRVPRDLPGSWCDPLEAFVAR